MNRHAITILAVLSAVVLILIVARPAQAQTETVLYNFCSQPNCGDGSQPESSLTFDSAGNLYGTTYSGGTFGAGTVYELSANGSGGWNETALYSFTGGADGSNPWNSNVIFDNGNLYGTTLNGGASDGGVVWELSPVGASWTETVLYSFGGEGSDGSGPSGLIMDSAGNLYGTIYGSEGGAVFELNPSGVEQTIFNNGYSAVIAGLTMHAGNIFGVMASYVLELSPNDGGWTPTTIFVFHNGFPKTTPVFDKAGNIYGTSIGKNKIGSVYKLTLGKKGGWTKKVVYAFGKGNDPLGAVVLDSAGDIYGTTSGGYGTVFELVAPVGTGKYQEKVLWNFDGTDGQYPGSSLTLDNAGNLYGAAGGGLHGDGVVFEVTP
jgi:uncharacterized repeat protein (TIGR03803 family)